jgi:hypothetical protein
LYLLSDDATRCLSLGPLLAYSENKREKTVTLKWAPYLTQGNALHELQRTLDCAHLLIELDDDGGSRLVSGLVIADSVTFPHGSLITQTAVVLPLDITDTH